MTGPLRRSAAASLPLLSVLAVSPLAAQGDFFSTDTVFVITIRTDLRSLLRDRDPEREIWRAGTVRWTDSSGERSAPVRLRTRGLWRLQNCEFPPIRLRFSRDSAAGSPFADLRRPKLVTHCGPRADEEQYVLQEYALYRVLRFLTPLSFSVRLLRVSWEDSSGAVRPVTRYAFITEDPVRLAERLGGELVPDSGLGMSRLAPSNAALLGVFQYFAGNTDWSVPGRHNIELFRRNDTTWALPYDFDWAGAIAARYARPAPVLPTRSVRERIYLGLCQSGVILEPVLARFEALRDSIAALYRSVPGMDPRVVQRTLDYYDEFYRAIRDRERFLERVVARDCRG